MNRESLVISSVGPDNSIRTWTRIDRSYDLALIDYSPEPLCFEDLSPQYLLQNKDYKCPNFVALFRKHPEILDSYKRFLFIDDDLILSSTDLEELLTYSRTSGVAICQPSLDRSSQYSWSHLLNKPGVDFEHTNFIEVQIFCMSVELLQRTLPFFGLALTGFGLDFVFHHFIEKHKFQASILHKIKTLHPKRSVQQTVHSRVNAKEEDLAILANLRFALDKMIPEDTHKLQAVIRGRTYPSYPKAILRNLLARVFQRLR